METEFLPGPGKQKAGTASAADLFTERTEIENLQAAINLMLESAYIVSDEEHLESLRMVVRKMKEEPLPWHTQRALIGKAAHKRTHATNVMQLLCDRMVEWFCGFADCD